MRFDNETPGAIKISRGKKNRLPCSEVEWKESGEKMTRLAPVCVFIRYIYNTRTQLRENRFDLAKKFLSVILKGCDPFFAVLYTRSGRQKFLHKKHIWKFGFEHVVFYFLLFGYWNTYVSPLYYAKNAGGEYAIFYFCVPKADILIVVRSMEMMRVRSDTECFIKIFQPSTNIYTKFSAR